MFKKVNSVKHLEMEGVYFFLVVKSLAELGRDKRN